MSIKKEFDKIDIPENLSERSKKGINQANKEKKKSSILPFISTIIITAATIFFVINSKDITLLNSTNAAQPISNKPYNPYSVMFALTFGVLTLSSFMVWKKWVRFHWIFILTITVLSISWNIAKFEVNSLIEPYVIPILEPVAADWMSIHYFINKKDGQTIETIYINDIPFEAFDSRERPLTAKERFVNQPLKTVDIFSNQINFKELLSDKATTMKAQFKDGTILPVSLIPYWSMNENQDFIDLSNTLSSSSPDNQFTYTGYIEVLEPFTIDQIEFAPSIINYFYMHFSVIPYDDELKGVNHAEKITFYQFAISQEKAQIDFSFNKGDLIEIIFGNMNSTKHLPLLDDIFTIQTSKGPIPIIVSNQNYLHYYEEMLATLIKKQRGEHNE